MVIQEVVHCLCKKAKVCLTFQEQVSLSLFSSKRTPLDYKAWTVDCGLWTAELPLYLWENRLPWQKAVDEDFILSVFL